MPTGEFCSRLDQFFLQLPRDFRYAVEVRNPGLLGMSYLQVLSQAWCCPCLQSLVLHAVPRRTACKDARLYRSVHSAAPVDALEAGGKETSGAVHEDSRGASADATRDSRHGRPSSEGRHAYVLVNNCSEGNAPLTVEALSEVLRN